MDIEKREVRDTIRVLRCLVERSIKFNQDLYMCFVDYEKTCRNLKWGRLLEVLTNIGADWRNSKFLQSLYLEQTAVEIAHNNWSEPNGIGRGVRQGCLTFPWLLHIYAEVVMKEASDGMDNGVKVGGELMQAIWFADDQAMIANSEKKLQMIMYETSRVVKKYRIKVNIKKTKVMKAGKSSCNVRLREDGVILLLAEEFKYLESLLSANGFSEKDI